MQHSLWRGRLLVLAFAFFMIVVTIDGAVTTDVSRLVILAVRYSSLALSILLTLVALHLGGWRRDRAFLLTVASMLVLIAWGVALAKLNAVSYVNGKVIAIGACVGVLGGYQLHQLQVRELNSELLIWFPVYALLALLMTIVAGGLDLDYPQHFRFDYISEVKGGQVLYSQGASRLYGLAAVLSMCGAAYFSGLMTRILYVLLAVFFLFFCLLGGARGESLAALLLVLGVAFWTFGLRALVMVLLVVSLIHVLVKDWSWLNDFVVFQRYAVTLTEPVNDGSQSAAEGLEADKKWGGRRILLEQSVSLMEEVPICLVTGCGFGYFQSYYGYPPGLYPHNEVIEAIIVYGLLLSGLCLVTLRSGWKIVLQQDPSGWVLATAFAYTVLLALKGGTLFGDPLLVAITVYLSWLSFVEGFWGRQWQKWRRGTPAQR